MTGSIVDRLKSSFSRGSSFSTEDQMCFLGMNQESSVSSLAVSSVVSFAKSPSDVSFISRSAATPPPENTTLSTTSSPASSTSSQPQSTEPNNAAPTLFNPPSLVLVPPETRPYAQLVFDKSCDTLTTLLVSSRGMSVPLTGSYICGEDDEDGRTEEQELLETCSSSSSSSGPGESGWSTGSDGMSSSKLSNGGGSVELMDSIVWIDERWFDSLDAENGAVHGLLGLEQRQALLGSESESHRVYIDRKRRWAESCLCCCNPVWERHPHDQDNYHKHHHASASRDKESRGCPSKWFRYRSLAD